VFFVLSPLEQFRILQVFSLSFGPFDFSLTNSTIITFFSFFCLTYLLSSLYTLSTEKGDGLHINLLPTNRWSLVFETVYSAIAALLEDNLDKKGNVFFPFVFAIFLFVIQANLIGLVPYSFTTTSHLVVTFALALSIFIGVNIIGVQIHKINILSLFFPQGTSLPLALLLVPIELVSYVFKPVSLSVRLFANMMAGHTLLKVIAGFAWTMMKNGIFLLIAHFIPLFVLVLLIGLELGVAMIQAYVFTILICIYLNDAINLH
jgi:ATP synthase subunit 6